MSSSCGVHSAAIRRLLSSVRLRQFHAKFLLAEIVRHKTACLFFFFLPIVMLDILDPGLWDFKFVSMFY